MGTYKFKYKKGFFWKTITVVGHNLVTEQDRMDVFFADGGIYSIGGWTKYDLRLGSDWVITVKKKMEEEAGQPITTRI